MANQEKLPESGGEFPSRLNEIRFLERLQTSEKIGDQTWSPEHWGRLQELREQESSGPTQAQIDRFNELSRLQSRGGNDWTEGLRKEIAELYPIMEERNK